MLQPTRYLYYGLLTKPPCTCQLSPYFDNVLRALVPAADADDTELPTWNVRFTLAKVLLELEQYMECVEVLERLVLENDQVMEAWYLLGEALLGEEEPTAPDVVQHAIGLIQKQREEADTPELAAEEEQMSKLLAVIVERIGHPSVAPGDQGQGAAADMDES